jgi:hypothetical protein
VRAGYIQCDLHRGVAACLPAPKIFFSPFPLARTCVVVAAKAWSVLDSGSLQVRVQRYLNEELAALHDAPLDTGDQAAHAYVEQHSADYLAIGATVGLRPGRRRNPRPWDAPFLVHPDERDTQTPPSETQLVRSLFEVVGLESGFQAGPAT